MVTIGIVGGTGYVAGELLRILSAHGLSEIKFVHSSTQAGHSVSAAHPDLTGSIELAFTDKIEATDALFLCMGHGLSADFINTHHIDSRTHIIDLGSDFRISQQHNERHFTYGLPEIYKDEICRAHNIANPGCFATAIELALLPLAAAQMLREAAHVCGITGSSGAGRNLSDTSHFSYRCNNLSVYKPFVHQHLQEIRKTLLSLNAAPFDINFIPVRGNFTRGIFATIYTPTTLTEEKLIALFEKFYEHKPFVHIVKHNLSLKDVINTNKCFLQVQKIEGKAFITSVIDNLVKGAAGQAVQNMNLMFGLPETTGLILKPTGM